MKQIEVVQEYGHKEFNDKVNSFLRKEGLAFGRIVYRTEVVPGMGVSYIAFIEYEKGLK